MGTSPHETKKRLDAMTATWPNWRSYRNVMSIKSIHHPPLEVMEWLCNFRTALLGGVESFERHIAGGGLNIEVVGTCDCNKEVLKESDPLAWLHANHEVYNRVQLRLIESTIGLMVFREILERDLTVEDNDLGPEWGNLHRKDYTKSILERLAT